MRYSPLNNQPNVSRTRYESISPSLKLDSRSFPHISYLEQQLGRYSFNYSFWDGLKWSYKDYPEVCISKEEIFASPNSIVLDDRESPVVSFARKIGSGNRLTLASYLDGWNFNNFDVDYDLNWIGVTKQKRGIEYSSSSSSSSSYVKNWSSSSSSSSSSSPSSLSSDSSSSRSSRSSNSSSSSSSSSSSNSSASSLSISSPSSSSSSSKSVSSSSSSIDSSSSSSGNSNSSSSSSDGKRIWVTAGTSFGTYLAQLSFYDDSFNFLHITPTALPFSYSSLVVDYKDDGYWVATTTKPTGLTWTDITFSKYSYYGALLSQRTMSYVDMGVASAVVNSIAIDEVNNFYYVTLWNPNSYSNRFSLVKFDASGWGSYTETPNFYGPALFLDKNSQYLYLLGNGTTAGKNVAKYTVGLVFVAERSGVENFTGGYLDGDFWYTVTLTSGTDYRVHQYSKDVNSMPDTDLGEVGVFPNFSGSIGKITEVPEQSSSTSSSSSSSPSSSSYSSPSSSSSSSPSSSSYSSSSSSSSSSYINNWSSSSTSSFSSSSSSSRGYSESSSSSSVDSNSSSSSSSYDDSPYFVTVYDTTNSEFKVYSVGAIWRLMGAKSASPNSCVKIDSCEANVGIGFIDAATNIQCNFFNTNTESWAFSSFTKLVASQTYDNVTDMDLAGYNIEDDGALSVGWFSKQDEYFYVCSEVIDSNGTETPTDGSNVVVESNAVDVVTDYIANGYNKLGVYKEGDYVGMFAIGSSCKYFLNYRNNTWVDELIDIGGISDGIVCSGIRNQNGRIAISSNSGDIYYYEFDPSGVGFDLSTPNMVLLNDKWAKNVDFASGYMNGIDISGTYDTYCGNILRDTIKRVSVVSNRVLFPPTTTSSTPTTSTTTPTTTTTTTTSLICCNSMGPSIYLPSGCALFGWYILWATGYVPGCKLYVTLSGYGSGIDVTVYRSISPPNFYCTGATSTGGFQAINLIGGWTPPAAGYVYWNGIQYNPLLDGPGPWEIHC